jgi:hypothetical protein
MIKLVVAAGGIVAVLMAIAAAPSISRYLKIRAM